MKYERDIRTGESAYKSRGEEQIARLLDRHRIAYKYEQPMAVVDHGKTKIWHPDFYLSQYGMVVEYFGLNDNPDYRRRSEHKMEVYHQNGIQGVFLNEESLRGDWPARVLGQIEDILTERMDRFYSCRRPAGAPVGPYERSNQYNSASL
jgi:hypothetical protein